MLDLTEAVRIVDPPSVCCPEQLAAVSTLCLEIQAGGRKGTVLDEFRKSKTGSAFLNDVIAINQAAIACQQVLTQVMDNTKAVKSIIETNKVGRDPDQVAP